MRVAGLAALYGAWMGLTLWAAWELLNVELPETAAGVAVIYAIGAAIGYWQGRRDVP